MNQEGSVEKLLVSYLLKELNQDQEEYVKELIENDQNLQRQCAALKSLLRIIEINEAVEKIAPEEELLAFGAAMKNTKRLDEPTVSNESFEKLPDYETKKLKSPRLLIAAASMILLIVLSSVFLNRSRRTSIDQAESPAPQRLLSEMVHESNFSGRTKTIVLPDGTLVALFDKSRIDFPRVFTGNRRDIRLDGKANFRVAKDKKRPFTVYSDAIGTTALGTQFTVTNYGGQPAIKVRLFEGKVVIRSVDTGSLSSQQAYFLSPGEELIYYKRNAAVSIKGTKHKDASLQDIAKDGFLDNPSMPSEKGGSWFMFNNQSLPEVFDQLSELYGVTIGYKKGELKNIYFIGKFERGDSLEYILRNIAGINKLTLLKRTNGYMIRK